MPITRTPESGSTGLMTTSVHIPINQAQYLELQKLLIENRSEDPISPENSSSLELVFNMAIQKVPFSSTTTGKEVVKAFAAQVNGKVILITGASKGGLGAETALSLATANPKKIILTGRSEGKIAPVLEQIKQINPNIETQFVALELGNQQSVRKAAAEVNASVSKIDILINNAGIMAVEKYAKTDDGVESQFGSNHVGPFLFTNLIANKFGENSRVINVTSMGYEASGIRFDDWNFQVNSLWLQTTREGPADFRHRTARLTTHGMLTVSPRQQTSSLPTL